MLQRSLCIACRQSLRQGSSSGASEYLLQRPLPFLRPPLPSTRPKRQIRHRYRMLNTASVLQQQSNHQDTSNTGQPNLNLTSSAIDKLESIRKAEKNPRVALRITVESGGCHGYQYKMDLDDISDAAVDYYKSGRPLLPVDSEAPGEVGEEEEEEIDRLVGLPAQIQSSNKDTLPYLIMDTLSLKLTKGSTIDYATELIGSSFRIDNNPQAKGAGCGCGVSWELNDDAL